MTATATVSTFTLRYEADFRSPFFRVADSRPAILEGLYRAFADLRLSPQDMYGFGGNALSDQRVRLHLFRGNASLEITAQKVFANFDNAAGQADFELIENCLRRLLQAVEAFAADSPLGAEHVTLYPNVNMESEEARDAFLRSLPYASVKLDFATNHQATVWPSFRVDVTHPKNEWLLDIGIQRAWHAPTMLFIPVNAYFYTGAKSESITERGRIVGEALASVFTSVGLKVGPGTQSVK